MPTATATRTKKDAFPLDASEWQDSDGDGIGDNADHHPNNPNCHEAGPCDKETAAIKEGGRAQIVEEGPGVLVREDTDGDGIPDNEDEDIDGDGLANDKDPHPMHPEAEKKGGRKLQEFKPKKSVYEDPSGLDKARKALPSQGYNEYGHGPTVQHDNSQTWTGDWTNEWPTVPSESEKQSIKRICREHPNNKWCNKYKKHGEFLR